MPENQTNNLKIDYLFQNQANKEVIVNEAFLKIDNFINTGAISQSVSTPPSNPSDGDLYIIGAAATDDWSTHEGKISYYSASKGWVIVEPNEGMSLWVNDEDLLYTYDGSAWIATGKVEELDKLGINATADATNRLAVKSDAVLFDNDGDDSQVKVNKNSAGDTASHLFQSNYSGYAEFGLTGDNDFHIKVSPDNFSTVYDALVVDKDNGDVEIKQNLKIDDKDFPYQTGTWTPVFVGSTTAGTNSYQTQEGRYTKIGDLCILEGEIFLDGTTVALDSAGSIEIHGLPFDIAGNEAGGVVASYSGLSITAGEALYMQASAQGSGEIRIQRGGASSAYRLTESEMTDSSRVQFSATYKVN